jgi:hypothetical protein
VSETTIEFNAKINSVTLKQTSSQRDSEVRCGGTWASQEKRSSSNKEERQFTMRVYVKAVQDDMPSGMRRLLSLLEEGFVDETVPPTFV